MSKNTQHDLTLNIDVAWFSKLSETLYILQLHIIEWFPQMHSHIQSHLLICIIAVKYDKVKAASLYQHQLLVVDRSIIV